jgi:ubiquitin-activating enzyme E1
VCRNWHIGQAKSKIASDAATRINPAFKLNALQNRVSPDTEGVFNDAFWQGLDLVVNALDNVNARLYVDSRRVPARATTPPVLWCGMWRSRRRVV